MEPKVISWSGYGSLVYVYLGNNVFIIISAQYYIVLTVMYRCMVQRIKAQGFTLDKHSTMRYIPILCCIVK